ncbi:MAG: PAS domain-containing protein [Nodosilinea sp.]
MPKSSLSSGFSHLLQRLPLKTVLVLAFVLQMLGALGLVGFAITYLGNWSIAVLSLCALGAAVVMGLAVVDRILKPVQQLKAAAMAMAQGNWQTPLPIDRADELGDLARAFNSMAAQLQNSFTELEQLSQTVQLSERRWRQFLDVIPVGITVYDRQGRLVFVSHEARQLLRLENLPSTPYTGLEETFVAYRAGTIDRYPTEALPIAQALRGEKGWADDLELHHGDRTVPIEMATTPIFDRSGQVEFAIAAFRDFTTRKQAETVLAEYSQTLEQQITERTAALRQAEATQRLILKAIPDLLVRYSGDGVCLGVMSPGTISFLHDLEPQVGQPMAALLPPAMVAERMHYIRLALATGQPQSYEYRFNGASGWRHEEARIVVSGKNEVLVIVRDVTERKQTEKSLRESQLLYRSLTEVLPHGLYRIDRAGRLTFANPAFLSLLNRPLEDCLGKPIAALFPPDSDQGYTANDEQVMATGQAISQIQTYPSLDGVHQSYFQVTKSPLYNADSDIIGMQGAFWDITDLKRTEAALASQKQFLQNVIDSIPSAIVVKDRHDRIQIANRASAAMHGLTPAAMLGRVDAEFNSNISAREHDYNRRINQQVIETQSTYQAEQEIIDMSGIRRWYQVVISPFQDAEGTIDGIIGNCIDITDRKLAETALKAANEKLERLATLDGLTQIPNRRRFDEYLQQEWQRLVREQQPLSLILFDVDYFKAYNDHFGHQQGDEGLIAIAQAASRAVKRSADLIARYGGEEFGVVLPNTNRAGAEIVARAIQRQLADLQLPHPQSEVSDYLTVSIGIASVVPSAEQSPEDLLAGADAALYQAKRRGRNRYWIRLI